MPIEKEPAARFAHSFNMQKTMKLDNAFNIVDEQQNIEVADESCNQEEEARKDLHETMKLDSDFFKTEDRKSMPIGKEPAAKFDHSFTMQKTMKLENAFNIVDELQGSNRDAESNMTEKEEQVVLEDRIEEGV